jgi:radical SAM superfamily enzyme YgiQ (UPF0313 family)
VKLGKIMLVRPNMGDYRSSDALPPLAMGILAARTPKDVEVRFYDDRVEALPLDEPADLVAMSVETFTARRAYHLAGHYRSRGIPVVMGGHHPTLLPDEALRHSDVIVTGDAEGAWDELLEDFRHGATRKLYRGKLGARGGRPDYGIFNGKKYGRADLVQYGRGCRHNCDFCSIHAFYGDNLTLRPAAEVADEIAALRKRHPGRLLMFVDDNLYSSSAGLAELLDAIRPIGARWACQISSDVVRDSRIMDRMALSGCRVALVGFESIDAGNLKAMKKGWSRSCGELLDVVRDFHSRGIAVCGTFIFGYDGDTAETIDATLEFVTKARLEMAHLNPLTPMPGTPFYERLKREGRLLHPEWWLDPGYRYGDPIIAPSGMDPEKFSQLCFEAKKRFYSWRAIAGRTLFPGSGFNLWNMAFIGLVNLISRHEVYRKQFRVVGA